MNGYQLMSNTQKYRTQVWIYLPTDQPSFHCDQNFSWNSYFYDWCIIFKCMYLFIVKIVKNVQDQEEEMA